MPFVWVRIHKSVRESCNPRQMENKYNVTFTYFNIANVIRMMLINLKMRTFLPLRNVDTNQMGDG